jgi:hypothetical protein
MRRNEIIFWLLFLILNSLLFLPGYLINAGSDTFFPLQGFLHGSLYERLKTVFVRQNHDIFRLSVDLLVIVTVYLFVRKRIKPRVYGWSTGIYYFLILAYFTYFTIFEKLFLIPPMIYNDVSLLKLGFVNIGGGQVFQSFGILLIVAVALYAVVWLVRKLILTAHDLTLGLFSKLVLGMFAFLIVVNTMKSGFTFGSDQAFEEGFALLASNIKNSLDAKRNLRNFNVDTLNAKMGYSNLRLGKKPDIYLIFIESYGKLLYVHDDLRSPYFKCLDSVEVNLDRKGWKAATGFSISPVSGGNSWVSYSTVLFGYNLRNEGTFNSLLKISSMARYDNLFNMLRHQGYKTYRLSAMPQNPNLEVPWETYSQFYSIDHWINFSDLNYTGRLYGFGPSPPDQYSINYADQWIKQDISGPRALFFITQTTHNPFYSPDSIVTDWRSLNKENERFTWQASVFLKKPVIKDYLKAVCYDISALGQFIASQSDTSAIFVLIGDHQPPVITGRQDGFETPVHIISRNREFIREFTQYGFNEGMRANILAKPVHHEGIYSLFMHEFVKFYGISGSKLPVYRPNGLTASGV